MSLTHKNDTETMRRLIADPGTWVVVGLSNNTDRDAHRVARWLKNEMHKAIIPVHHQAEVVDGDQGYATISDIPDGDVKVVDLFVNSSEVGALVDEVIAKAREITDRPVVIDFVVERDAMVWPMVPAGVSNDLITMARDITPVWDRDEDDADDVNIPDEDEAVEAAREDGAATADAAQTKEQQR